jgi:chemotaxis protein MotA
MILMLNSITDVEQVPQRMAVALTAAFYGLGSGYLLFMPIAGTLRRRSEEELFVNEIIIRGVLLLQGGVSPRLIEAGLNAFLNPAQRVAAEVPKK